MQGLAKSHLSMRCRSRCKHTHLQPHAARCASRLASAHQLMAPGTGLLMPRLDGVPLDHRLIADDRLAVMMAETLVELDKQARFKHTLPAEGAFCAKLGVSSDLICAVTI